MLPLGQGSDDYQTPPEALGPLLPHLQPGWAIWECACGKGRLVQALRHTGFTVVGTDKEKDFLNWQPDHFDCIVTNPPYSLKNEFLRRAYALGKPFAFLLPITGLETKPRQRLFQAHGIDLIVLDERLRFERPAGVKSRPHFYSAWFCWGLGLPRELSFAMTSQPRNVPILNTMKGMTMNDQPETTPINEAHLTAAIPGLPDPEPTESSSLDDLAAYGLRKQGQIIARDKANAEDMWLMGRALRWAKAKLPHGSWEKWFRAKGFNKTWAWQARKLSVKATLEQVKDLGLTAALVRFGIDKPKPAPAKAKANGKKQEGGDKVLKPTTQVEPEGIHEEEQPEPEEVDTPADEGTEEPAPEDEEESEEDSEAAEEEGVFRETLKLFPNHIRATAVLNALEDLNDDLAGPCDSDLLNTFDLILDVVEAIKLKGHEDDNDLQQYQPATIPDDLLAG